jgi:hypothetical protein
MISIRGSSMTVLRRLRIDVMKEVMIFEIFVNCFASDRYLLIPSPVIDIY